MVVYAVLCFAFCCVVVDLLCCFMVVWMFVSLSLGFCYLFVFRDACFVWWLICVVFVFIVVC